MLVHQQMLLLSLGIYVQNTVCVYKVHLSTSYVQTAVGIVTGLMIIF